MSGQDNLRDRIWTVIADTLCPGNGGYRLLKHRDAAQAIIDSLGLSSTTCCEVCTGVTIEGYYDTLFD